MRKKILRKIVLIAALSSLSVLIACNGSSGGNGDNSETPVDDPPVSSNPPVEFSASRVQLNEGESTVISWSSPAADSVFISPDIGIVESSGERTVSPAQTITYEITATSGDDVNIKSLTIVVRQLAAVTLRANTVEGFAPLKVRFTPDVDSLTAINRFYWDFEGDGGDEDGGLGTGVLGFDRIPGFGSFDVVGREFVYEFDEPGTYRTRVRVWDVDNNQAESSLTIQVKNAPPVAQIRVTPTRATAPFTASFTVTAQDNEGISAYDFDFDGDGIFDESSERRSVSHLYDVPGEYTPIVRISDSLGASTVLDPIHLQVDAQLEQVPTVKLDTSTRNYTGKAPFDVDFFGTSTSAGVSNWSWDFDGDGNADSTVGSGSSQTNNRVSHTYDVVGTFYPTLTVTSADGAVGKDIIAIVVESDHQLSVSNSTFNPEKDEKSTVQLTLNGTSETQLVIEGANGLEKTLAPWATRPSGEYSFSWDGKGDNNTILPPGPYYVVLRYKVDGLEKVLDLRETTGGLVFYPSGWSGGGCRYTETPECGTLVISENSIQPFADKPIVYDFTIPYNARMNAYVTIVGSADFAPASFFRSKPLAAGSYSIEWFGQGTNGKLLPQRVSGRGYVPAIFGTTDSDNAIYLSHYTTILNASAEPSIFFPSETALGSRTSQLQIELNRPSNVVMTIDSMNAGTQVYRYEYSDLDSGINQLEWDGRTADGELLAPGGYLIKFTAYDKFGQQSLPALAVQRIKY